MNTHIYIYPQLFVKREKDRLIAEEIARQIELERIRILEEEARIAAELEEQRKIEVYKYAYAYMCTHA